MITPTPQEIKELTTLREMLELDELSFNDIGKFCMLAYRMNVNPLPIVRKYFAMSGSKIPINYIETECSVSYEELLSRNNSRAPVLIIINTIKREGLARAVNLYKIIGTLITRL